MYAIQLCFDFLIFSFDEKFSEHTGENVNCIESYLLFLCCSDHDEMISENILKLALKSAVSLCYANKVLCQRFAHLISSSLLQNPGREVWSDFSFSLSHLSIFNDFIFILRKVQFIVDKGVVRDRQLGASCS